MSKYAQQVDDLRGAARYIQDHGWVRGTALDRFGRVCTLGAIAKATGTSVTAADGIDDSDRYEEAARLFDDWLVFWSCYSGIADWNDDFVTSGQVVVQSLEKAAAWIEEQA